MFALKKLFAGSLAFGLLVPAFAFAQTATTSVGAQINTIQAIQAQINSLQLQKQQAVTALVNTFQQGSSGDQVIILQALLAADPSVYPEGIISGFFGKFTAQAVKRFQKQNGLEQVGNVGPKTLKKLQELLNKNPLAFATASSTATSTAGRRGDDKDKRPCAIVPPGHLIAPGWLKKHRGEDRVTVPECQTIPKGIQDRDDDDDDDDDEHATTTPPIADITAPVISAASVSTVASTTATVSWTTNENATGKVYYATSSPFVLGTALAINNASLTTNHSFGLAGLTASTTYFYVLESKDAANNTATTSVQSFATTP
jgi:hypothetical protein